MSRILPLACRHCRHSQHESHTAVNLVCAVLVCARANCRQCRQCQQQSIAIPIYVITYVITFTYFFQISKIHYQHDQHLAVVIGGPHQNRMTEPATNRGTNRTADNRRGNTRINAFWSIGGKVSAMLVKLSAVQTAPNDQQNCHLCDRQQCKGIGYNAIVKPTNTLK